MHTVEVLIKAGQNNHGVQLQPMQVQELLNEFATYAQANAIMEQRVATATGIAGVLLERLGGSADLRAEEYSEFVESEGFDAKWDEETGDIHVEMAQVGLSVVRTEDEAALGEGDAGVAPVSEISGADESEEGPAPESGTV
jgi:hypothetical protein